MKYMIMMFGDQAGMMEQRSVDWIREMIQFMHKLNEELTTEGELVSALGLTDPSQAKTVRLQDGVPVPTDGPFAESKEALAGFWIVEVDDEGRALRIASRVAAYIGAPVEVRQIVDRPPEV